MTSITEQSPPADAKSPRNPVFDVTLYEHVTSFLLALLMMLGGSAAGLGVLWASNHISAGRGQPARVELVAAESDFVDEFGGGYWDGTLDGGAVEIPGPEGDEHSAEDSDAPSADSIALEATISHVADRASAATELAEHLISDVPAGLAVGTRGTSRTRLVGRNKGDKGAPPAAERWEIVFEKGLTEAEYARQLDFLNVELGVVVDDKLFRVSQFAASKPAVRVTVPRAGEHEVMFVWRDERRRQVDIGLLRRVNELPVADNAVVLHFYPSATALKLARLERDYAAEHGRPDVRVVAKTRFGVRRTDAGYDFDILNQRYFARYEGEERR